MKGTYPMYDGDLFDLGNIVLEVIAVPDKAAVAGRFICLYAVNILFVFLCIDHFYLDI